MDDRFFLGQGGQNVAPALFSSCIFLVKLTVSWLKAPLLLNPRSRILVNKRAIIVEAYNYWALSVFFFLNKNWALHACIHTRTENDGDPGFLGYALQFDPVWELQGFCHWSRCVDTMPSWVIHPSVYIPHHTSERIRLSQVFFFFLLSRCMTMICAPVCHCDSPAGACAS